MLKSYGWVVGLCCGSPCDFSVGPSPFDLDFGTLDFGTSDSGLTIFSSLFKLDINAIQACTGWGLISEIKYALTVTSICVLVTF